MKKRNSGFCTVFFILYCSLLAVALFLRNGRDFSFEITVLGQRLSENANFVPFKTINNYITALESGNVSVSVVRNNLIGNLLLFLPMGYFLPKLSGKKGLIVNEIKILGIIVSVEFLQLITGLGSFDVDDIILNFAGSLAGYVIFFVISKLIKKTDS